MMNPLGLFHLLMETSWISAKTAFQHYFRETEQRSELLYAEAFSIVKTFLRLSGNAPCEDLQQFTSTPAPSPHYVLVLRVRVPAVKLDEAAEHLTRYLGDEGIELAGGRTWWKQRLEPDKGMQAEWISMKRDYDGKDIKENMKHPRDTSGPAPAYEGSMDEQRCMYYIHGGGYYFGSIDTHRYSIWRMARKMAGRAFAVKYRLACQYPWPCALQDCLAGYLYLIRPPPDAPHKAVDPAQIIMAGDSAGGGLTIALLCLLRDLDLPLPASSVLISPWVDMTESFPSIMTNVETDVIPPYGFLHKPSLVWPPPAPHEVLQARRHMLESLRNRVPDLVHRFYGDVEKKKPNWWSTTQSSFPADLHGSVEQTGESGTSDLGDKAEPDDVVELQSDGETMVLKDQVHLYCTNKQLSHPCVSPALTPSLAGLPPLLIIAGDSEVLRDEILYLAHKAAHPEKFPLRETLLDKHGNRRRQELAQKKKWKPTQVHLQVYDGMCHDIALFSFIQPAKFCYRTIASFCIRTTSPTSVKGNQSDAASDNSRAPSHQSSADQMKEAGHHNGSHRLKVSIPNHLQPRHRTSSGNLSRRKDKDFQRGTVYFPELPESYSPIVDNMIRERVDMKGVVRTLEPMEELQACQTPPEDIGLLKAAMVKRYLQGRTLWDKKFARAAKSVRKERMKKMEKAIDHEEHHLRRIASYVRRRSVDDEQAEADASEDIRFGLFGLAHEVPPPSSLAARRDASEAQQIGRAPDQESKAGRKALKFWNTVQNLTWFTGDDEPVGTDSSASKNASPTRAAPDVKPISDQTKMVSSPTDMRRD